MPGVIGRDEAARAKTLDERQGHRWTILRAMRTVLEVDGLFDGERVVSNAAIVVADGTIAWAGKRGAVPKTPHGERSEPMHPGGLGEHCRHAVEAVQRVDDHRHDREEETDRDLRQVAKADDHDEQRIERVHRHRVISGEQRIEHAARRRPAVQRRAERDARERRGCDGDGDVPERHGDVARVLAGDEDPGERGRHRRGRDQGEARDDAGAAE